MYYNRASGGGRNSFVDGSLRVAMLALLMIPGSGLSSARAQVPIAGGYAEEASELVSGAAIAPDHSLRISITMALRNRDQLEKLIAAQQDPSSPLYHRWLTADEFNDRFGPTADDLAMVEGWLTKSGLSVESASMSRHKVVASGEASIVEKAFGVKIAASPDGKTYANLVDPLVPAQIAPLIASIHGLANTMHREHQVSLQQADQTQPEATIGGDTAFGPRDLWTFYDETALNSSGITGAGADCIALVEDSDFEDTSLLAFDAAFGLPPAMVTRVLPDGGNPGPVPGDGLVEANLDVQYAHAAAPGAPISVYLGVDSPPNSGSGLIDGLRAAVNDNSCGAIALTFAFCGVPPSFYTGTLDPLLMQAAAQGQAVFVSAGDEGAAGLRAGANGCVPARRRTVSELAADPNVTAVGGTQFSAEFQGGNVTGYTSESVWHDKAPIPKSARGAGGGGQSAIFAKPSFQSGVIPKSKRRSIPDISMAASVFSPGFFFAEGGSVTCCIGGTSIGSPIWAGISALGAQSAGVTRVGNLNTKLYSLGPSGNTASSGLHEVASGINSFQGVQGFKAKPGYDRATGWGTPDIGILVPLLGP